MEFFSIYSHVAELVSNCEGGAEAVVLDDGAALLGIADGADLGQPQRAATRQIVVTAQVLPKKAFLKIRRHLQFMLGKVFNNSYLSIQ